MCPALADRVVEVVGALAMRRALIPDVTKLGHVWGFPLPVFTDAAIGGHGAEIAVSLCRFHLFYPSPFPKLRQQQDKWQRMEY